MFSMVGHQPATQQTIRLGAMTEGRLVAIDHQSVSPTAMTEDYIEYAANASRFLWAASSGISTVTRSYASIGIRRPRCGRRTRFGSASHSSAPWTNLAYKTGVDQVELRLRNDTMTDPYTGRPFSTRAIRQRPPQALSGLAGLSELPHQVRCVEALSLIGQGVACAVYTHWRWPGTTRMVMGRNGPISVESSMHDIGTGTYTVMTRVAADELKAPA